MKLYSVVSSGSAQVRTVLLFYAELPRHQGQAKQSHVLPSLWPAMQPTLLPHLLLSQCAAVADKRRANAFQANAA